MDPILLEVAIILALGSVLSVVFRFLKQPANLAYVLGGVLIGPVGLIHVGGEDFFHPLSVLERGKQRRVIRACRI